MTGGLPPEVKIELEADQPIKFLDPSADDQPMAHLEVMLKEEGKEPKVEESWLIISACASIYV